MSETKLAPGREMDRQVAEKMGLTVAWRKPDSMPADWPEDWMHCFDYHGGLVWDDVPQYAKEISDAFQLIDFAATKGYTCHMVFEPNPILKSNAAYCAFTKLVTDKTDGLKTTLVFRGYAETRPGAVCRAFLALDLE